MTTPQNAQKCVSNIRAFLLWRLLQTVSQGTNINEFTAAGTGEEKKLTLTEIVTPLCKYDEIDQIAAGGQSTRKYLSFSKNHDLVSQDDPQTSFYKDTIWILSKLQQTTVHK